MYEKYGTLSIITTCIFFTILSFGSVSELDCLQVKLIECNPYLAVRKMHIFRDRWKALLVRWRQCVGDPNPHLIMYLIFKVRYKVRYKVYNVAEVWTGSRQRSYFSHSNFGTMERERESFGCSSSDGQSMPVYTLAVQTSAVCRCLNRLAVKYIWFYPPIFNQFY